MAKEKRVPLSEPLEGHGDQKFTEAVLREPTLADLEDLGEPSVLARNADDTFYAVENDPAIKAYIERLTLEPPHAILRTACLRDALAIKGAVLGFFNAARAPK